MDIGPRTQGTQTVVGWGVLGGALCGGGWGGGVLWGGGGGGGGGWFESDGHGAVLT